MFINHEDQRYRDTIGSCTEAKRVGWRSRYQLYYVTGHTGARSATPEEEEGGRAERGATKKRDCEKCNASTNEKNKVRVPDRGSKAKEEKWNKTNEERTKERRRRIETTRRRGRDVGCEEGGEQARERKRSLENVKRQRPWRSAPGIRATWPLRDGLAEASHDTDVVVTPALHSPRLKLNGLRSYRPLRHSSAWNGRRPPYFALPP